MPLLKDIQTTLNKISMQSEKSNLQFEKTINSIKASIKSMKDTRSNIKDLKISNDEYNKALQKSQTNSTKLLKQVDNYLENPTQEEALKVKNQINVSNNYLTKAKNVFSNNKISSDKLINSFKEYENDGLITNFDKLNKLNSRLAPSFTKLINYFGKLKAETQAKTQTQSKNKTRKVYLDPKPTPHPNCLKYYDKLAREKRNRTNAEMNLAQSERELAALETRIKPMQKKFNDLVQSNNDAFNLLEEQVDSEIKIINNYTACLARVENDNNGTLEGLNRQLGYATGRNETEKIRYWKAEIESFTRRSNENIDAFQKAILELGPMSKESIENLEKSYKYGYDKYMNEKNELWKDLIYLEQFLPEKKRNVSRDKQELFLINVIIGRFEKWIKINCR